MSYDPIGRLLKVTAIGGSQKEKLNHVPNTVINPLQLTGKKMKTIIEQNPPGSIPVPSRVRSVTIDVVGKPKTLFKEDNVDLSKAKRSVERHLSKPFGYSEKILSKSKNQRESSQNIQNKTTYQHPDVWNQSINTESKRKQFNLTKDQTLQTLKSMNKKQRDEFIFKSHNQAKIIENFYTSLRKVLKKRQYTQQYGEDIDQDVEESELLNKLFNAYTRLRNIQIGQRTDQKFIYLEELKDFCFTIGFNSDSQGENLIEQFYEQIYNPELLQDAKIISKKPSLHSLRTMTIIEQLIPGQALVKKSDMVSMRAINYNYKKYLHENFEILQKFSRNASKQILVDLLANINPWVYQKKLLKLTLQRSQELEQEFFTIQNLYGNEQIIKQVNKRIKERDEQVQEKLILSKFIHQMVRNNFLKIDSLKENFVKQIVSKAEKISVLEDFMVGLLQHLFSSIQGAESVESQEEISDRQSDCSQEKETNQIQQENKQLHLEKIADFIHNNKYRGDQYDIIINFLVKIKKQVNEKNQTQNNEYLMSEDITCFCTQYKEKQDYKQSVIKKYIEKAKKFYDKHLGDVDINEENRKKFDSNTVGTYTLKKMQKYDSIIGSRASKVNQILNLVQKRVIYGVDSVYYDGPIEENDFFEQIVSILNSELKDFKIQMLFNENFVHSYFQDYQEMLEKEKLKAKGWDDEIQQALQLYQRESQRLLNVVQSWKPKEKQKKSKQQQSPQANRNSKGFDGIRQSAQTKSNQQIKLSAQQLNKQFLQDFIENEEKDLEKNNAAKLDSQKSLYSQNLKEAQKNQQQKVQQENKTDSTTKIKKQNPTQHVIQSNIKDQVQKSSLQKIQQIQSERKKSTQEQNSQIKQRQSEIKQLQQRQLNEQDQIQQIDQQKNNFNQNENLSFFEFIDNQYGYSDDKNNSFQSKQGQKGSYINKDSSQNKLNSIYNNQKTNNITKPKDSSPNHSSHNDLSTINKTNQDSINNDPQIQKTNQMYTDLFNILNSIKDEFDIV
ncbi:hypothetical protein TTHERM_01164170 (macronuclear) [Tetrahymena thermophila SB210]|uniref:Uncharacterized protein n=1 Tax=Tetrahymena thermophila (strain SB210) TaxID=312017 RepID=Q22AS1_TETTS|nr:hypothetical protein TTHERM_01164170 [Tetrahymena thermophila SB210]EAR82397.2 hypothetical protein TTHERM_01164170 [Tetrahymena thermophila SB210]|eukprot:XP_001030060.2 hypothetical protein TTHERM_01164170 [Tetrahymena thermophila SB210]